MTSRDSLYIGDAWPQTPDGSDSDGKELMSLTSEGKGPFAKDWDVQLLIAELEQKLGSKVLDVPIVEKGSNNYGFHVILADKRHVVARLANGDVNMPKFDGFAVKRQVLEIKFEAAVHQLLHREAGIPVSNLLYYRPPVQYDGERTTKPSDLMSRRLVVVERTPGRQAEWVWAE